MLIIESDCELFGSSANGFGTAYSDLDICLKLPYSKLQQVSWHDKNNRLYRQVSLHMHVDVSTIPIRLIPYFIVIILLLCIRHICL